ncbi:hypothetical protein CC2G_009916 [Coprinopsis cinerea AmutBmut pab1-1]|jgi:glutathione S-transferase|nr:hypothetical protein CC2G_009916 [Coprinopsis cinerea AmutBmut pab1-1]
MIILYDLPSNLPTQAWSGNTWKARFCLNYKGLPYKTEWVEYPDVPSIYKKHGISPVCSFGEGGKYYSLPVIHDTSTGTTIAESLEIAKYLDATYPDAPSVLPKVVEGSAEALSDQAEVVKIIDGDYPLVLPITLHSVGKILNPPSKAHVVQTRAQILGLFGVGTIEEFKFSEEDVNKGWDHLKSIFDALDKKFGGEDGKFGWYLGGRISFADFALGGSLLFLKTAWGEDSSEWAKVKNWHNGKWVAALNALDSYTTVV